MRALVGVWSFILFWNVADTAFAVRKMDAIEHSPSRLQLTTVIAGHRYCKGRGGSLPTLELELGLRYTNLGNTDLILYRGAGIVNRQLVSLSMEDARFERFVFTTSLTVFASEPPSVTGQPPPSESFVVLPPKSSFETETRTVLLLRTSDEKAVEGPLRDGDYFLQIEVSTWPGARTAAEKLRAQWRQIGDFWYSNITSKPMMLSIEKDRHPLDCSQFSDLLEAARTNANAQDRSGFTALMAAVYEHNEGLFVDLLRRGANLNAKTNSGRTALMLAAAQSEVDFLKQLLRRGADPNAKANDEVTALLEAVEKCDAESIKLLIDAGADVNARDKKGNTPLIQAKRVCSSDDQEEIVHMLFQAGAKR
jgi:hypothetical protein